MLSKFEMTGIALSVLLMAVALYLVRIDTSLLSVGDSSTQVAQAPNSGIVVVGEDDGTNQETARALYEAVDSRGNLNKLVIDDVTIGEGEAVEVGDIVTVDYVGRLQDGQEFDNSKKRGAPFVFKVGQEKVIKGWEQGIVGMKVGGQRILVIPPDLAYGNQKVGPVPANATLVFSIELLEIK